MNFIFRKPSISERRQWCSFCKIFIQKIVKLAVKNGPDGCQKLAVQIEPSTKLLHVCAINSMDAHVCLNKIVKVRLEVCVMLSVYFLDCSCVWKALLLIQKAFVCVSIWCCWVPFFIDGVWFVQSILAFLIVEKAPYFSESFHLLPENLNVFGIEILGLFGGSEAIGGAKRLIVAVGDGIEFFDQNFVFSHEVLVLIFYAD